jgi:hypothetical protein
VIHKKKVQELRGWMEAHLPGSQRRGIPKVLLVTGEGVGEACNPTIRVTSTIAAGERSAVLHA